MTEKAKIFENLKENPLNNENFPLTNTNMVMENNSLINKVKESNEIGVTRSPIGLGIFSKKISYLPIKDQDPIFINKK